MADAGDKQLTKTYIFLSRISQKTYMFVFSPMSLTLLDSSVDTRGARAKAFQGLGPGIAGRIP